MKFSSIFILFTSVKNWSKILSVKVSCSYKFVFIIINFFRIGNSGDLILVLDSGVLLVDLLAPHYETEIFMLHTLSVKIRLTSSKLKYLIKYLSLQFLSVQVYLFVLCSNS